MEIKEKYVHSDIIGKISKRYQNQTIRQRKRPICLSF